jgi:hypothetical protein
MDVNFDKDSFLTIFEADDLRSKAWKVIKKLEFDMA